MLRNPAGRPRTQPTRCLSAPARTLAAPPPWGWLGGFLMQGSASAALSTIRCGRAAPSQPMRSEKRHPFRSLPNHSIPSFCSSSRTSAAQRRENRVPSAAVRRKHVIWAPLGELRALVEVRMHELLWLPRSARRADGDETRSRAKSGEAGDWADRNAAFCCSFCSRRSHLTHATGHFSPAASGRSFISPLVFLAQGAPKQSARNQGAPRFSDTVVCLR